MRLRNRTTSPTVILPCCEGGKETISKGQLFVAETWLYDTRWINEAILQPVGGNLLLTRRVTWPVRGGVTQSDLDHCKQGLKDQKRVRMATKSV
jgi:hypothetical protein